MDELLKSLVTDCQAWMKEYTGYDNKKPYQEKYKQYYQFAQFCNTYFKSKEQNQWGDLENIRKEHHQWQTTFKKKNYLSTDQNPVTIKTSYQDLLRLKNRMDVIDWEHVEVTTNRLDRQFKKEVDDWISNCKQWLASNGGVKHVELNALELAQGFLDAVKMARMT